MERQISPEFQNQELLIEIKEYKAIILIFDNGNCLLLMRVLNVISLIKKNGPEYFLCSFCMVQKQHQLLFSWSRQSFLWKTFQGIQYIMWQIIELFRGKLLYACTNSTTDIKDNNKRNIVIALLWKRYLYQKLDYTLFLFYFVCTILI